MKKYKIEINGKVFEVGVEEIGSGVVTQAPVRTQAPTPVQAAPVQASSTTVASADAVSAPMPGTVLDIKVNVGDSVNAGDTLLILEAMKMENEIAATKSGVVKSIEINKGSAVQTGQALVVVE
jgi:biotin carboxyl carrier protein